MPQPISRADLVAMVNVMQASDRLIFFQELGRWPNPDGKAPEKIEKGGYQRQSGGTNGGTKWVLKKQNLASMRVTSHLSIDPSPP